MRILVVDDEHSVRGFVARCLTIYSYDVETAVNGCDAYTLARRQMFDAAITDLKMPVLNGLSFASKLRIEQPNIKILMMTGYRPEAGQQQKIHQVADSFIVKPFTVRILMDAVDAMMGYPRHSHIINGP